MKKKILSLVLAVIMIAGILPVIPVGAETSGDWEYEVSDGTATITEYTGNDRDVIVPSSLAEYSVTSISYSVFYWCEGLTSITIPGSVTFIDDSAFARCTSLTSITVDSQNQNYSSENGVLYNKDKTILIYCPMGKTEESFTMPNSVTDIGNDAFRGCENLTSIIISDKVTSIGNSAFNSCTGLTAITIPNSVTDIGTYAFAYCDSLTSITLPAGITSIGEGMFMFCESLESITIPAGVTSIDEYAFASCTSLAYITIPASVASIAKSVFASCESLTSITVNSQNQNFSSENGILYNKIRTTIVRYPMGKTEKSFNIPDGITSIADNAFASCTGLTSITIPTNVTSIGVAAFEECESLISITIPDKVTSIEGWAFWGCESLISITIPDSVTSIADNAFRGCDDLTIYGDEGSYAKSYATEKGITFELRIALTGITLDKTEATINKNTTINLTVGYTPTDTTNKIITWSSSDIKIATVDNGVVTAKNAGTAVITATVGNYTATCMVTVKNPKPKNGWLNGYYYKNNQLQKKKWVTVKGKKYRTNNKGKMIKNKVVKISKKYYALGKNGVLVKKKWFKRKKRWYRANNKGVLFKNKTVRIGKKKFKFNKKAVCTNKK